MDLPRILCVDDEPAILKGMQVFLRRNFEVSTAADATEALALIAEPPPFAVVLSDKDMPGMSGVALLTKVRELAPDTVRIMFTGKGDLESAIEAIHQGQIFRFLTKPCEPAVLLAACQDASRQHDLLISERVLLEQTLQGSIKTLTDMLAIVSPQAFGRAGRLERLVDAINEQAGNVRHWQIKVATMLSQIGAIALPPSTAEKVYEGRELDPREQAMVEQMPQLAEGWLANIPRLEEVLAIIRHQDRRFDGGAPPSEPRGEKIPLGARLIKIAVDYDRLLSRKTSADVAVEALRRRLGWYDPKLLDALTKLVAERETDAVHVIPLREAEAGMVFAADVRSQTGALLIAKGFVLTPGLLQRMLNLAPGTVQEPVQVLGAGRGSEVS